MSEWTPEQVRASAKLGPNVMAEKLNRLEAEIAKLKAAIEDWRKEEVLWKEREAELLEDQRGSDGNEAD